MCVVSMVLDHGQRRWSEVIENPIRTYPRPSAGWPPDTPTRKEFDELKAAVEAAKQIDKLTDQEDCELDDKVKWFKRLEERVIAIEDAMQPRGYVQISDDDRAYFRAPGSGTTLNKREAHVYTYAEYLKLQPGTTLLFVPLSQAPEQKPAYDVLARDLRRASGFLDKLSSMVSSDTMLELSETLATWAASFEVSE